MAFRSFDITRWGVVFEGLISDGLETISPKEAKRRVDTGGWVLVDVRLSEAFERGHAEGAVSVPMYRSITFNDPDLVTKLRYVLYKANGVNPVDENKQFDRQLQAATEGGAKGAVLLCEAGGTLVPSVNFPKGKSSRSLQGSYRGLKAGVKVAHLDRGLYGWYNANLPMVGVYTPELGRTPNAAIDPDQANENRAIGYDVRWGDKESKEPEAESKKKNWFDL